MYDNKELENIKKKKNEWKNNCYSKHVKKHPERKENFKNLSLIDIERIYTPDNIDHLD